MGTYQNKIVTQLDFVTGSQVGLKELETLLNRLKTEAQAVSTSLGGNTMEKDFQQAIHAAEKLQQIVAASTNVKLGKIDFTEVTSQINKAYGSMEKLQQQLHKGGAHGDRIFNSFNNSLLKTNLQLKESNRLIDEMATSFGNTVKWGISSSVFNTLTGSLSKAWDYAKNLDSSLNDIRIVTGKSADEMERFAKIANNSAKSLGASTLDYTEAALIYYQQGDSDAVARAKADVTLKTANVTGQSGQEVSEQLTAVWNGYKVSAEEAELYIDKLAAVAASTASDLEELSTGMSKVASAANIMGVDIDQLNATLATVVSVTRQAPESVGTAFKTIYARMGDIEAGLDAETTLGSYTEKIKEIAGVNVLDTNGQLRDMGEVIEEVGEKWGSLSREQQIALSQTMAGTRQYNNLLALFDNWDMYTKALNTSARAAGTLQKQQDIYMESTAAHLQELETEWERLYNEIFDQKTANGFIDILTLGLTTIGDYIEGLGGGLNALINMGAGVGQVFSKNIAKSIATKQFNRQTQKDNEVQMKEYLANAENKVYSENLSEGENTIEEQNLERAKQLLSISKYLTSEEFQQLNTQRDEIRALELKIQKTKELKQAGSTASIEKSKAQGLKEEAAYILSYIQDVEDAWAGLKEASVGVPPNEQDLEEISNYATEIQKIANMFSQNDSEENIYGGGLDWEGSLKEQAQLLDELNISTASLRIGGDARQITEEQINALLTAQKTALQNIETEQRERLNNAQLLEDAENNIYETQVKQAELEARDFDKKINVKTQEQQNQQYVETTMTAIQATTALIGGLGVLANEGSTGAEKANASWSMFSTTVSTIATAIWGPIGGMIASGLAGIAKAGLEAFGVWDSVEELFMSAEEQMEKAQKEITELQTKTKQAAEQMFDGKEAQQYFQENKVRFNELQRLAEQGLLSSNLRTEYENYLKKVQEYNKDIIISYDEQGRMINRNTNLIQDTIDKLEEENKLLLSQSYGGDNWDTYAKAQEDDYNAKTKAWGDAKEDYHERVWDNTREHDLHGNPIQLGWGIRDFISNRDTDTIALFADSAYGKEAANFEKIFTEPDKWEEQIKDPEKWKQDSLQAVDDYIAWLEEKDYIDWFNEDSKKRNIEGLKKYIDRYYNELVEIQAEYSSKKASTIDSRSVDLSFILKNIMYDPAQNGSYVNLAEELGEDLTDTILQAYVDSINISSKKYLDKKGKLSLEKVRDDIKEFETTFIDLLSGANGDELQKHLTNALSLDKTTMSSDEYEKQLRQEIEAFLALIETEEQFNKIKDSLPAMFGVSGVSAQWTKDGAKLGKNGGNIYTYGEKNARSAGNTLAELYVEDESQRQGFSNGIEDYLQKNLNEVELSNLDVEQFASDFNDILFNALNEDGTFKEGMSLEKVVDQALEQQTGLEEAQLTNAIGRYSSEIEEEGLKVEDYKDYTKHIMEMADESDILADSLKDDADAAAIVAKSTMRMNKGVGTLSENFEEWNDVLKNSEESSEEYSKALNGMRDAVADVLDVEEDAIDSDFITKNLPLIEKAAKGNAKAIEDLRDAYEDEILLDISADNLLDDAKINSLKDRLNGLQEDMPKLDVGKIDDAAFIESCQQLINDAGMTAEQANEMFAAMGIEPEYETTEDEVEVKKPITRTVTVNNSKVETLPDGTQVPITDTSTYSYVDGYIPIKETILKVAMGANGKTPQIKSLTKKATGTMNNSSSVNKGGGSGGGSKKSKVDKTKGNKDRYHDVNVELKQISNNLDKIQKEQDGLTGADLIANLTKQYALLNKQLDKTAEKIRIAEGEASELQTSLSAKGAKFNADGTISNYFELYDKELAKLHAIEDKYDKMSEKQREKYQETLDKARENFEKFEEELARYDEIITDEIPGMMSEMQEILNKQIELKLEAFEYEVKIRLDLAEAKKEWNEFKADILEGKDLDNDPLAAARVNRQNMDTYYNSDGTGSLQAATAHINKIMEQLAQMDADQVAGIYGETYTYKNSKGEDVTIDYNNRKKALEDLKTYIDENIGGLTEFNELMGDIYGNYVDLLGKIQEGFDKQTEAFETLDSMIQHDMELIKMAYGEEAYDKLSELYDKDLENSKAKLAALGAQVDYWKKEVADQRAYVDTLEEGTDEWFRATEALTAAEESLNGAIDAESQAVLDAMQKVTDKLLFNIDKVFSELNKSLTDGLGLEYASMEWELIGKSADEYLDTVNAIYSTQQLQNKYLDAIEKSSNPAHQKKLNDLMEQETKYLREQDKLSQYDLDRANLKYELALKQIALEEAQQNKSKLRLRRDSQGNYTYQYTADDDQVASVQQEINDLYNQLYNLDADEYRGNLEKIYDVWAEAQEKIKEAAQINDPKVRAEYEQKITEEYGALINGLVEKNENLKSNLYQSTMSQLLELYNTDTANYEQMTEDQKAILDEYITAETELNGAAFDNMFGLYNENIVNLQSMADEQKNILMASIVPQWDSAYQKMTDAIVGEGGFENTLKVAFEQISNMAKTAFEELAKYETEYREKSDDNKNYIQDQLTSAERLLKMYQDDLPEIKTLIKDLAKAWDEVTSSIGLATTAASNYYTTTQEKNANDAKDEDVEPTNEEGGKEGSGDTGGNNDTGSGGNTGNNQDSKPSLTKGSSIKLKAGTKWYSNSYGGGSYGSTAKQKSVTITLVNESGSHPYHVNQLGWVRKKDIVGYASGGYTGDWAGSDGRLAMLHKKELILNAHDTDNMLDAITILRDITSNLGATLLNRMASINASGIGALGAAGAAAGLEQMVTINAEFPNVTNSHEIEDAINNLVNRASQHIHKN